jgi:hypothetical protein
MIAWGKTQTELLVSRGAPALPDGYTYKLHFQHPALSYDDRPPKAARVTASIMDERGVELASYTEVTRASLDMASVAAAKRAFEWWGQ